MWSYLESLERAIAEFLGVSSGDVAVEPLGDGLASSILFPDSSNNASCDWRTNEPQLSLHYKSRINNNDYWLLYLILLLSSKKLSFIFTDN